MSPATYELFHAIISADVFAVQRALAAGADVNASDELGRNVLSYAAFGTAIDAIHAAVQPRLSEQRLDILRLIAQQPELTLYSLNAPMAWAGGVTLLGLMSWLNMPSELVCLLDLTHGLLEVNAMDEHGATPLMYAARDGNQQVVQRLLAHGARPDLREVNQRSAIQYALLHPQSLWLCEETLRRSRQSEFVTSGVSVTSKLRAHCMPPCYSNIEPPADDLFFYHQRFLSPPSMAWFDEMDFRRTFDILLRAIRKHDVGALKKALYTPLSNRVTLHEPSEVSPSLGVPLLVNLRDGTGLTLVHHAVSQRPYPSIAILDALHGVGSDVGLYSTLGFSPLHHLARTAKDGSKRTEDKQVPSLSSVSSRAHPLYTFTRHFVRDLRASLRATDSKGETPLHAAAEHGRSVPVLLAMLDCDRECSEMAAAREVRNERGLRPVDVARREFIPLFLGRHHSHPTLHSESQRDDFPSSNPQPQLALCGHSLETSLARSNKLTKKVSTTSFISRSSSSSNSSGAHSYGTYWSPYRSQPPHRLYKAPTLLRTLLPPETTPPRRFANSPHSYLAIDAPACSIDVLRHLSFTAYALHSYTQGYTGHGVDTNALPDLPSLADTLLFSRDLASHVLEHWTARLESARETFEHVRRDLSKARALREYVGHDVQTTCTKQRTKSTRRVGSKLRTVSSGELESSAVIAFDPDASEDLHERGLTPVDNGSSNSTVKMTVQGQADSVQCPALSGDNNTAHVDNTAVMEGDDTAVAAPEQSTLDRRPSASKLANISNNVRASDRDGMTSSTCRRRPDVGAGETLLPPNNSVVDASVSVSLQHDNDDNSTTIPMVLQRVDQDLHNVLDYFVLIHQSYVRAQESIAQARALVEESIKVREDQLALLLAILHRQDTLTPSSRLSPIFERSPPSQSDPYDDTDTSTTIDVQTIAALGLIEEPHTLRRLFTCKLAKYVQNVFDKLQKVQVWLRIIREVLRGFRRRTLIKRDNIKLETPH